MDIFAEITGIKYQKVFTSELKLINSSKFDVNFMPSTCLLSCCDHSLNFTICKWVSPKRTRSYPYQRVYDILSSSKKISIIPVIKEVLTTLSKASITIKNYLGGLYFFTVDEISIIDNQLYLIESKHSKNSKLPSLSDIKDGLLKMILYSNLEKTKLNDNFIVQIPVLNLSSSKLFGLIDSYKDDTEKVNLFAHKNKLSHKQIDIITILFREAKINNFIIKIEGNFQKENYCINIYYKISKFLTH